MFRRQKTSKSLGIKLYNTVAIPALIYGSENCTTTAKYARRKTAAEMKYMRKTAGNAWTNYKTITEIARELNINPLLDRIQDYRRKWLQHINKMPRNRLPRIIKNCRPKAKRNRGRPLKPLLEV
jgi:hypothetical protein